MKKIRRQISSKIKIAANAKISTKFVANVGKNPRTKFANRTPIGSVGTWKNFVGKLVDFVEKNRQNSFSYKIMLRKIDKIPFLTRLCEKKIDKIFFAFLNGSVGTWNDFAGQTAASAKKID